VKEDVAVKTIEDGASEEDRIRFLQEAAIMGQFDHPNIIKLIGATLNWKNEKV
jgi:serine/threonine protein kinase